ncbi:MAG: GAF domain-containing protein [Cytophagia bacterium]|nr:GAF domain-containing protein [Cytophagia bacterium]NBW34417.1 GAF domain-containing protein [Cytophagia bacterium]
MKWIDYLVDIGVDATMPSEMRVVLKTTNVVNLFLVVALCFFTILFFFIAPRLMLLTVGGIFASGLSLLLSYNRFSIVSRLIAGCAIDFIAVPFYLLVIGNNGNHIPQIFAAVSIITLFPWFLFTAKEYGFALLSFCFNLLPLIFIDELKNDLPLGDGFPVMRSGVLPNTFLMIAIVVLACAIFAMQVVSQSEAGKAKRLLAERDTEKRLSSEKEAKLTEMLEQLQQAKLDEEKRMWASKGLAEIGKILREMKDEQQVADQLISFLVKYLNANQGAIFTLSNNEFFILRSCYAYDRKKYINKKINVGEGIIGQCYYEKTYSYITQVPADYVHITSGLGFATPRALIVVPLLANDQVHGAMEFASFTPFEKHQIDFLMDAGESLAIALMNIAVSEQTKELLNETQNMAEEMRTQEEEMRQNMEELAATQEQQLRNEQVLRSLLEEKDLLIEDLRNQLSLKKPQHV